MFTQLVETRVGRLKVSDTAEVGSRSTAVLWHSLFVDERSWDRVLPALAEDRRIISVTGPGHGASGDPGRLYSMDGCVEAALQVLEALGVEGPVDWVGNAWGGHVGIMLAAGHPERVRTLVAAGAPTHPYTLSGRLRTQLLVALYRWLGPIAYLADAVTDTLLSERTRATDPSAAELVRSCFVNADRARLSNAIVSLSLRRRDLKPLLPGVWAPTLFMTGSEHSDWTPDQMRAAAGLLPLGSTHVVDGAAYLVPLEAPTEFSRVVREFWAASQS